MNTVRFPSQPHLSTTDSSTSTDRHAQKKDIAAYLSSHIQPNHNTTVTLSDRSGKSIILKCNTDNPSHLLDIAMTYLNS